MRMYLNHRRQKAQKMHGKTSVKKLVGEGVGVSSIEVTDGNIKSFERVARKYNVDFAVKKDKTTAGVSLLAFEVYAFYIKSVARSFYSQLLLLWIPMRTKFPLCFLSAFFLMLFLIPFI